MLYDDGLRGLTSSSSPPKEVMNCMLSSSGEALRLCEWERERDSERERDGEREGRPTGRVAA